MTSINNTAVKRIGTGIEGGDVLHKTVPYVRRDPNKDYKDGWE